MKPRIRMSIVAAGEEDPGGAVAVLDDGTSVGRWHATALLENRWTSDGRWFQNIGVRQEALDRAALPLMALDRTTYEHQEAVLVGNADTFEKRGDELHLWGSYLSKPDEEAANLIGMIERGELPGFSADVEATEVEVLYPIESSDDSAAADDTGSGDEDDTAPAEVEEPPTETDDDGNEFMVFPMDMPRLRITEGQLMGGTAVPFPAFEGTWIGPDETLTAAAVEQLYTRRGPTGVIAPVRPLVASGVTSVRDRVDGPREAAPTRFDFPVIPPASWFDVPETPGPMPLTILDSGQVFGHLALWGECHIGIAGECVEPPRSACNYARFHVGEIPVDDPPGRVACGRLTFHTGHADTKLNGPAALAHYDNTGAVGADLRASDGEYGIWACGAMRSTLSIEQVREIMSSPPSGDWRRWGHDLELVGALCVNVPGFNTVRERLTAAGQPYTAPVQAVKMRKDDGLVASLIVSHAAGMPELRLSRPGDGLDPDVARRIIRRIAATIGRSDRDRIAAVAARVKGSR